MHGYELPLARLSTWPTCGAVSKGKWLHHFSQTNCSIIAAMLTKLLQLSYLDFGVIFLADTTFKKKKAKILVIQK
jgi:hypothetical protein